MGVVHKLIPEVKEFVIEKKRLEPGISCRAITALISDKFKVKLSKSSANYLFKQAGLSMPVGRRLKTGRGMTGPLYSGMCFLKAADSMLGGSFYIGEAIKQLTAEEDAVKKTETLLEGYMRNLVLEKEAGDLPAYSRNLDDNSALISEIALILKKITEEVLCVKVAFLDGKNFYLDGQLHTVWPSGRIPPAFSSTLYSLESRLFSHFKQGRPLVLFFAPGYRQPGREFFDFIRNFSSAEKQRLRLTFYNNKQEAIKETEIESSEACRFVFGIWPWQFKDHIKVNISGEFKQSSFTALKKDYYIAAAEVDLLALEKDGGSALAGCILKDGLNEKIKLTILAGPVNVKAGPEALAKDYLDAWPSPEDSLQSFSRKIEAFSQKKTQPEQTFGDNFTVNPAISTVEALLNNYLQLLELYVKHSFLTEKYLTEDPALIKKRFYLHKGSLKQTSGSLLVSFNLAAGQPLLKDIDYVCQRINEKQIILATGKRLWLKTLSSGA